MTNSENVSTYCDRVQAIVKDLKVNGEKMEEQRVVEKVLCSLPDKYEYVAATIEEEHNT